MIVWKIREQPHYREMLNDLEAIFQAHQTNGTVTIEHDTQAYYGQFLNAVWGRLRRPP